MSKFKKSLHVLFINLACLSSDTPNLQRVFRRIYDAKGGVIVPGVPSGDRENWQ